MENKVNILGVKVDKVNIAQAVDRIFKMLEENKPHSIFTPNSEIILEAYKNAEFCRILNSADLLTADGIGVVYASKILGNPISQRAAGYDIACGLIKRIAETGHRLYLFGGKPGIAEKAKRRLEERYPFMQIVGTRNGYFKDNENTDIINDINSVGADIVFVCLGAPKQEKWIAQNKDRLNARVLMGIGGSLDVFAGEVERAPDIWCKMGLEWLYRLIKEPWRFKRMLALPKFGITILIHGRKFGKEDNNEQADCN